MQDLKNIKAHLCEFINEVTKPTKAKNQYICPMCHSGTGRNGTGAFTFYPATNTYHCFSCGASGDIFKLYADINNFNLKSDFKTVLKEVSEKYGIQSDSSFTLPKKPENKPEKDYTKFLQYAESRLHETNYLSRRGISADVQRRFRCGYIPNFNSNGTTTPAVIIPTSNFSFMWRSTNSNLKQKCGQTRILNPSALNNEYCFVVEGEIDCMSVYECGNFPCIATGSTSNISKIFDYDLSKTILILAFDNDKAGRKAAKDLECLCDERRVPYITAPDIWSDCKDANDLLIKNKSILTENLKKYADMAKSFDFNTFNSQKVQTQPAQTSEEWVKPEAFEAPENLPEFPLWALPDVLQEYLIAVCEYVQVPHEMAILPLLSTLATCVQGKAVVKHPYNSHTQPLNLYTITVAVPGERKSGTLTEFLKPLTAYQHDYNEKHRADVEKYNTELAYLENQRNKAINGKAPDLQLAKDISEEIARLKENPISELILNVSDVTPEALAFEMSKQGEKMAIIDHEGGIFDVISGLYSSKTPNIDLFLKGYDGDQYNILRRGNGNISLKNPLLTVGIMTQPEKLETAIENKQFMGRGLMHRFLFSFPKVNNRINISSPDIPENLNNLYKKIITTQLERPIGKAIPVMQFAESTKDLFINYFTHIELERQQAENMPDYREWLSKHFSRALRIAGIFHLIENVPDKKISAQTVQKAIAVAKWAEPQAKKVFCDAVTECPDDKSAKYVLEKIKEIRSSEISSRELLRKCRKISNIEELNKILRTLEEMNYIRIETEKTIRKPKEIIRVNPQILK